MEAFIKQRGIKHAEEVKVEPKVEVPKVERKDKTSEVLKHLQEKGSITSLEAFSLYGATRLSAIIFNLKKRGYDITSESEKCTDRYGHACTYSRYILSEE